MTATNTTATGPVRLPGIGLRRACTAVLSVFPLDRAVERHAFYEPVRQAYAIVQTGELQPYANFLFRKGVLGTALER
jgi:L-fucose mutarotase